MTYRHALPAAAIVAALFAAPALAQDAAQPELELSPLTIVSGDTRHAFTVELANDPIEISTGMMFRESMAADRGMLFDLGEPREASFWMKNTLIPLDMLFINSEGEILAIAENAVPRSERQVAPGVVSKAVLELNGGASAELGLSPGDVVEHAIFGNNEAE